MSKLRSFVCRDRLLSLQQRHIFDALWLKYGVDIDDNRLNLNNVFQNDAPTMLEIGFGSGTSLLASADNNPAINFLGIEVYRRGVFKLLNAIERRQLTNIRVICADAAKVLAANFADQSLQGVHIYFPDPWSKRRHHKRRLIQPAFIETLCLKLAIGGYIHIKTDWQDYARHIQEILASNEHLLAACPGELFKSCPLTKYELRALVLGHAIHEMYFIKRREVSCSR